MRHPWVWVDEPAKELGHRWSWKVCKYYGEDL